MKALALPAANAAQNLNIRRETIWPNGLRVFVMSTVAFGMTACASFVDPTEVDVSQSIPTAQTWSETVTSGDHIPDYTPEALPETNWVESFDDPVLTALVFEGRNENPSVRRAVAQLDSALKARRISRADLYPTLNFGSRISRNEGGTGFFAGSTTYSAGFDSRWEIDLFGRLRDQIGSDGAAVLAADADLAALELSTAGRIANAWFDAIEAELLVDLSARDIETQERSLRLTVRRFEGGLTGSSDVRLARSNLANSRATEKLRIQNRNIAIRSLQTLIRDYPDAKLELPETLPTLPSLTGVGSPDLMLQRRPDIQAAEARIAQAGLNVDVARKALYPSLVINASVADEAVSNNAPLAQGGQRANLLDVLDLSQLAYSLSESLTAPIFQGGRLDAQVEARRAQLEAQIETYAETVLTAYQEVENALDAEDLLRERENELRTALDEAQFAEDRLETRYIEGLATILQLLDAQTRRLNAEGQLIGAQAERLSNRVRLHVALGGAGYQPGADIERASQPVDQLDELVPENILPESFLP